MSPSLDVIALISGGKDSLFSMLHCVANGHRVVALANLYPPEPSASGNPRPSTQHFSPPGVREAVTPEEPVDDIDSYMYQTVGHTVIPLYEEALGIPLFRQEIKGGARNVSTSYHHPQAQQMTTHDEPPDETESLIPLLERVKQAHPEANAVSTGAILSDYQRTRVESVALRLGLIPLSFLWHFPSLPPGHPTSLLDDMRAVGLEARIVKVASGGLDASYLWENVATESGESRLTQASKRYGGEGAVLGEGGEFETLALDGPAPVWKKRIVIEEEHRKVIQVGGGAFLLRIEKAVLVTKSDPLAKTTSGSSLSGAAHVDQLRRPDLLDDDFDPQPSWRRAMPFPWSVKRGKNEVFISNMISERIVADAAGQTEDITHRLKVLLDTLGLSPDDVVYTIVFLRSMDSFTIFNRTYALLFAEPNPPARMTVALGDTMPPDVDVMLSMVVGATPESSRSGLHVQSRSYWAPANIGPYSQAVSTRACQGCNDGSGLGSVVYVAGQIPLVPITMDLVSRVDAPEAIDGLADFKIQSVLALQHLWRIGRVMQVNWWIGGIAFMTRGDDIRTRVKIAAECWEKRNSINEMPKEEEQTDIDVWDRTYGTLKSIRSEHQKTNSLPDLVMIDSEDGEPPDCPFLAVEVEELPRGSEIEWAALGSAAGKCTVARPIWKKQGVLIHKWQMSGTGQMMICATVAYDSPDAVIGQVLSKLAVGSNGGAIRPSSLEVEQISQSGERSTDTAYLPSPGESSSAYNTDQDEGFHRCVHPASKPSSRDSGTEADDEGPAYFKGLPAPPIRSRKGLRDSRGASIEATPSPLLTPALVANDNRKFPAANLGDGGDVGADEAAIVDLQKRLERFRRKRRAELVRRGLELLILGAIGLIVLFHPDVWHLARERRRELLSHGVTVMALLLLYPLLLLFTTDRADKPVSERIRIPSSFDPAPLLYPTYLPICTALSLLSSIPDLLTANLALSLSALPSQLIPTLSLLPCRGPLHWLLTCVPLQAAGSFTTSPPGSFDADLLTFIYPLHQSLLPALQYLTSTSLLPAELHLLSISLINLLSFSVSPQAVVLKALLWGGGIGLFLTCNKVLKSAVALARTPNWRFRRAGQVVRAQNTLLGLASRTPLSWTLDPKSQSGKKHTAASDADEDGPPGVRLQKSSESSLENTRLLTQSQFGVSTDHPRLQPGMENGDAFVHDAISSIRLLDGSWSPRGRPSKDSLGSSVQGLVSDRLTTTGRARRRTASSVHHTPRLTQWQATALKWLYATYVYATVLLIALVGVRIYVGKRALGGQEPVGWAIGYLFGDIEQVRASAFDYGLDRWMSLPVESVEFLSLPTNLGWIERLRQNVLGVANTRLLISGYCLVILTAGIGTVVHLSDTVEVDTRRKVFHGMMVAMFLPATYVDPAFVGLAFALILAIFLLLDLFRASQLPPLSKPLAFFLTPYVDGRDLRGPVVVSHIFLLIGCAIPLWLSLAGLERSDHGNWVGWELNSREVSMVSGVVCVGMGDAAASLIGRRFGRRKWPWSGGKSLEGSLAFAAAVTGGLCLAKMWLCVGGWPGCNGDGWSTTLMKAIMASLVASLTEAVLTGGNDNVVVPVVLWLVVRGLQI
ncbi:MAG: hypothetical protein M1817_003591 [Caeruleum heppii]|nr:MAG: hypothetical protein M1817_003591 [Caeruleum heppii]